MNNIETIQLAQTGPVAELILQRPERKNALNFPMYRALSAHLQALDKNPEVRCLILRGTDSCFTSGNDLQDFSADLDFAAGDNPILSFIKSWLAFSKPTLIACAGPAVGIGTTVLLHSDFVYAAPNSYFKLPFTSLGLCPEFGSSLMLPLRVGQLKANDWLMSGRRIEVAEAMAAGLLSEVVDDPIAKARQQAQVLAAQAPKALVQTKALLKQAFAQQLMDLIDLEAQTFTHLLQSDEFKEAAQAFFEKRAPRFS